MQACADALVPVFTVNWKVVAVNPVDKTKLVVGTTEFPASSVKYTF